MYSLTDSFVSYYWREGKSPSKKWMKSQYGFFLVLHILAHWLIDGNS